MELVQKAIRACINLTICGLLLCVGLVMSISTFQTPVGDPAWKQNGPFGAFVFFLLALFSAYLAYGFRQNRPRGSSWVACSMICSLACVAFLSVVLVWALRHA